MILLALHYIWITDSSHSTNHFCQHSKHASRTTMFSQLTTTSTTSPLKASISKWISPLHCLLPRNLAIFETRPIYDSKEHSVNTFFIFLFFPVILLHADLDWPAYFYLVHQAGYVCHSTSDFPKKNGIVTFASQCTGWSCLSGDSPSNRC